VILVQEWQIVCLVMGNSYLSYAIAKNPEVIYCIT